MPVFFFFIVGYYTHNKLPCTSAGIPAYRHVFSSAVCLHPRAEAPVVGIDDFQCHLSGGACDCPSILYQKHPACFKFSCFQFIYNLTPLLWYCGVCIRRHRRCKYTRFNCLHAGIPNDPLKINHNLNEYLLSVPVLKWLFL